MNEKPRVIYIMSDRRSGSTLLEYILSKSGETISVGELAMLNGHILKKGGGFRWDWKCSCGEPILKCPFWHSVLNNKNYFHELTTPETQTKWRGKFFSVILLATFPSLSKRLISFLNSGNQNKIATETDNKIYNSIFQISGKNIIIDSSKDPDQAAAIYFSKRNFDMDIIWLKKDIRSIAASKRKWRQLNGQFIFPLWMLVIVAFFYKRTCLSVSKIIDKKNLFEIDYENLATSPQEQLNAILDKFSMAYFKAPERFEIQGEHTIAGTPERFSNRPIKLDETWKKYYEKNKMAYSIGGMLNKI